MDGYDLTAGADGPVGLARIRGLPHRGVDVVGGLEADVLRTPPARSSSLRVTARRRGRADLGAALRLFDARSPPSIDSSRARRETLFGRRIAQSADLLSPLTGRWARRGMEPRVPIVTPHRKEARMSAPRFRPCQQRCRCGRLAVRACTD